MPSMTGVMLSTVDVTQKTTANSLANLSYNILGFLPGPFVYGFIYDFGTGGHGRIAIATIMFAPIICIALLCYAIFRIFKEDTFDFKGQKVRKNIKKSLNAIN